MDVAPTLHPRLREALDLLDPSDAELVVAHAPGRVNLIGEHTDYNDGLCMPFAIDRACHVAIRPRSDKKVVIASADVPADDQVVRLVKGAVPEGAPSWARYVAAVLAELDVTPKGGLDIAIASDVPLGAGLSSSAALEVAIATALAPEMDPRELAAACQRAEHAASGVPCGIMDQLASAACEDGSAMLLDCRELTWEQVPIPAEVELLVVHSGVVRRLAKASYAERRRSCEEAARRLGLTSLRDATLADVKDDRIARHVVTENQRVIDFAAALADDDLRRAGRILDAGHDSLSHDFRVSLTEVDALAAELRSAGALGARLTGGGFGGCVVAMVPAGERDRIATRVVDRYMDRTGLDATIYKVRASAGASRD